MSAGEGRGANECALSCVDDQHPVPAIAATPGLRRRDGSARPVRASLASLLA
jgi:hypothetical protein